MAIEPESEDLLTQEETYTVNALGVCGKDYSVWAVTDDRQRCIICGRLPDALIPLTETGAEPLGLAGADGPEAPAPASETMFGLPCPHCGEMLELNVTPDNVYFSPHPANGEHTASLETPSAEALTPPAEVRPQPRHEMTGCIGGFLPVSPIDRRPSVTRCPQCEAEGFTPSPAAEAPAEAAEIAQP